MRKLEGKMKKKNPVLEIEHICLCSFTLYLSLISGIAILTIYGGRSDSVQFKCSFWEKKEKQEKFLPPSWR